MEYESMTPDYFGLIHQQLLHMENDWRAVGADGYRIRLLQMDVRILKAFCLCLETWDYSVDEESMERWGSVITPLKVIWPKDFQGLLCILVQIDVLKGHPFDMCIEYFNLAMSALEVKVVESKQQFLQSKQQFEGRYRNSIMQCKPSKLEQILEFTVEIRLNLVSFSAFRADEIVPLKKQSDILIAKIEFLERKLSKVRHFPDGGEIFQFVNFVGNFANSVACLTCLYWAKEDDHEFACEMNTVLFDMLQKFIPYAIDIAPILYNDFLKSDDLQPVSDSFLLAEAVGSIVDFLFEHLAIVLKDDFLILRDRLMFLFTFLTNPRCENTEEGDSIRSQIYAILHQDEYLHLFFDEMNEDFCDKKALLSGCMTRIDIANAKIMQLNCRSSASWITLEVEEMEYNYIVSVHRELSSVEKHAKRAVREQIQLCKTELRFLRVFLLWLATGDDTDEETKVKLM